MPEMDYTYEQIAKMIDHALLTPTLTVDELQAGVETALAYEVASVCIMPYWLGPCVEMLAGSSVAPSTTIGFPHGVQPTAVKRAEAEIAVAGGCQELDMVVNLSLVKSGRWEEVGQDIAAVIEVAHDASRKVKVIFENCYLDDPQKVRLCEISSDLGADWVKTSTGFGTGGATEDDLKLMRKAAAAHVQVKAAGGVREFDELLAVRSLGVTRVGASRTQAILDECRQRLDLPKLDVQRSAANGY